MAGRPGPIRLKDNLTPREAGIKGLNQPGGGASLKEPLRFSGSKEQRFQ